MHTFMTSLRQRSPRARIVLLAGLVLAVCAATVVLDLLGVPGLGELIRGAAITAAVWAWWGAHDEQWRLDNDPRSRVPTPRRRWFLVAFVLLWLAALSTVGKSVPGSVAGTVNAAVLGAVMLLWSRCANDPAPEEVQARWEWGKQWHDRRASTAQETTDSDPATDRDLDAEVTDEDFIQFCVLAQEDQLSAAQALAEDEALADRVTAEAPQLSQALFLLWQTQQLDTEESSVSG